MILSLDDKAMLWFSTEFNLSAPLSIRLYPQYAGLGVKHKGFTLAFSAEAPTNAGFLKEVKGITFYVEEGDRWFFEDTNTILSFDESLKEIIVSYEDEILN